MWLENYYTSPLRVVEISNSLCAWPQIVPYMEYGVCLAFTIASLGLQSFCNGTGAIATYYSTDCIVASVQLLLTTVQTALLLCSVIL